MSRFLILASGILLFWTATAQSDEVELEKGICPFTPVAVGDVDGDNSEEILFGFSWGNRNARQGTIVSCAVVDYEDRLRQVWRAILPDTEPRVSDLFVADVDTDGANEIIVANSDRGDYNPDGRIRIFEHIGDHVYIEVWSHVIGEYVFPRNVFVGDADNDGKNELLVGLGFYGRTLMIFEHVCGDDYALSCTGVSGVDIQSVFVGDADDDGLNEILVGRGNWGPYDARSYDYQDGIFTLEWSYVFGGDSMFLSVIQTTTA